MFKKNFIVIPLITVLVAALGGFLTSSGIMNGWYDSLMMPDFAPPRELFGPVWTSIYLLTTLAALIVWNTFKPTKRWEWIIGLFIANAALNVLWSFLFFSQQMISASLVEIFVLNATTIALMVLIWPLSRWVALLLLPYVGWVSFATYLLIEIWNLNG
jgi:tryptophan-rich sensory protein